MNECMYTFRISENKRKSKAANLPKQGNSIKFMMSSSSSNAKKCIQSSMEVSLHKPLLFLPTPGSKTKVLGIRYSDSSEYLEFYNDEDFSSLPINNGFEDEGKCKVIDFESDLFVGSLLLRIKGANPVPKDTKKKVNYFDNRKRTFQGIVRGKFKRNDIAMQQCVTGQIFHHEPGNLPPKFVLNTAINLMQRLAPQVYIEFGKNPRFLSPLCATAQRIVSFEPGKTLKPKSIHRPCQAEDESFWMGVIRCISGQHFQQNAPMRKEASANINEANSDSEFGKDPFLVVVDNDDDQLSSRRSGTVRAIKNMVRRVSIYEEETSHVEFSDIPERFQTKEEEKSDSRAAAKTVQRLSSILTGENVSLDDDSAPDRGSFLNSSDEDHSMARPNLEVDTEEPNDESSIIFEIPNQAPSKSKNENTRLKHRKMIFNDIFSKRGSKEQIETKFCENKEYSFEFYQHLLAFDDFSMKLPFHRPKLAVTLNGQPLQFMAAHLCNPASMDEVDYLWSFDIWHSSLLGES